MQLLRHARAGSAPSERRASRRPVKTFSCPSDGRIWSQPQGGYKFPNHGQPGHLSPADNNILEVPLEWPGCGAPRVPLCIRSGGPPPARQLSSCAKQSLSDGAKVGHPLAPTRKLGRLSLGQQARIRSPLNGGVAGTLACLEKTVFRAFGRNYSCFAKYRLLPGRPGPWPTGAA